MLIQVNWNITSEVVSITRIGEGYQTHIRFIIPSQESHTLENTIPTLMENLGIPRNHISQLMGHEDSNMALDVHSSVLAIEYMVESIMKLTYGEEVDSYIKDTLKNSN